MSSIRWYERAWWNVRHWLCAHGIHTIRWDEAATPMNYDPPEPPEPGHACSWCGTIRDPYSWWIRERTTWPLKVALFEWRARRRARLSAKRRAREHPFRIGDGVRYVGPEEPEPIVFHNDWPTSGPGWPE